MARNFDVPRSQKDYKTQVCEEIEGRVTKKLSQEFSRTETRLLGALARLDDFLRNPLIQGHSGTAPETSRNAFSTGHGTNGDDSQTDPHPEAGIFNNQTTQNSGREDRHDTFLLDSYSSFISITFCLYSLLFFLLSVCFSEHIVLGFLDDIQILIRFQKSKEYAAFFKKTYWNID